MGITFSAFARKPLIQSALNAAGNANNADHGLDGLQAYRAEQQHQREAARPHYQTLMAAVDAQYELASQQYAGGQMPATGMQAVAMAKFIEANPHDWASRVAKALESDVQAESPEMVRRYTMYMLDLRSGYLNDPAPRAHVEQLITRDAWDLLDSDQQDKWSAAIAKHSVEGLETALSMMYDELMGRELEYIYANHREGAHT